MANAQTTTTDRAANVSFSLPDAASAASNALDAALDFCVAKMKLADRDAAVAALQQRNSGAHGYFEYGLARQLGEHIAALDDEVRAVYLYDVEATEEDAVFGAAPERLVHMVIWAQRRTSALHSLVAALDRATVERYADVMNAPEQAHLLDVQIVDDAEVNSRTGFGAMLNWVHHRPLLVWKR